MESIKIISACLGGGGQENLTSRWLKKKQKNKLALRADLSARFLACA